MKKLLEVKEFDSITGNKDYEKDANYSYLEEPAFSELISFIHEFTSDESNADALEVMRIGYKRGPGDIVSFKNYVGLIQLKSGYQIQVLPKISYAHDSDSDNRTTKTIFLKMLRCMKDFQSKVFNAANLNIDRMNLYEIFINMYLQEVNNLVKHGLKSTYVSEEDNLSTVKGKISIKDQVQKNLVNRSRFYCYFDEYEVDRSENKLIKSTLLKLINISSSQDNIRTAKLLLNHFEMVQPSTNYDYDFSKVTIDRNTKDYELLMRWSKAFLKNKSFTTFSGDTVSRALLFPMDKLFEAYVAKMIKKESSPLGWDVSTQDRGYYLFDEPSSQFALRPDIVVTKDDGTLVILDTKWKSLNSSYRDNYGISQADMYQMYAYAKKYTKTDKIPEVWLLYPLNNEMRGHDPISFSSDDGVKVSVFFVDLENMDDSVAELLKKI